MGIELKDRPLRVITPARYRQIFISDILDIAGDARALWIPNLSDTLTTLDETRHAQFWTYSKSLASFDTSISPLGNGYEVVFNGTDEQVDTDNDNRYIFGDGASDEPFSVFALVQVVAGTSIQTILSRYDVTTGDTKQEWIFFINGEERPVLQLYDDSVTSAYIGRESLTALTTNTRYFLVVTYDGTGVSAGIRIYIDAVRSNDNEIAGAGTYVAIENTDAPLKLGNILNTNTVADLLWSGRMALAGLCAKELNIHEIWQMKELINAYYDLSL